MTILSALFFLTLALAFFAIGFAYGRLSATPGSAYAEGYRDALNACTPALSESPHFSEESLHPFPET